VIRREAASIARALWIAWAIVVWNVVFDYVIVAAGRNVVRAAAVTATPLNIDAFMRPAATQALWIATAAAASILLIGLSSLHLVRSR